MSSPATRLGRKSARTEPGTIHPEMSRRRRLNVGSCESPSAVCAAIHSCREPITCFDIGFLPSAPSIVYPVQLYDERTVTFRTRCAESEPKACSVVGEAGERSGEPSAQMRGDRCYRSCQQRRNAMPDPTEARVTFLWTIQDTHNLFPEPSNSNCTFSTIEWALPTK
jgi:hypothetical protein